MNLEQKLKRFKELEKKNFLMPEEIEERLQLEDEIELELRESGLTLNQFQNTSEPKDTEETKDQYYKKVSEEKDAAKNPEKKQKMTIYEKFIKPRLKGKPVTWYEIEQLKLQAMKSRLQRHISEDKAKIRQAKSDRFNAIFGMVTGRGNESKSSKKRSKGSDKKEEGDLRKMLGTNDPTKYQKLFKP